MVTKVVGEVNGQTIIFKLNEKGSWVATVPFQEDGEWIASLYAYDDYGNVAFVTKILYAISGHELTIKILDEGYRGKLQDIFMNSSIVSTGFAGGIEERGYTGEVEDGGLSCELENKDYNGEVEDRGFIGSLLSCSDGHENGGI